MASELILVLRDFYATGNAPARGCALPRLPALEILLAAAVRAPLPQGWRDELRTRFAAASERALAPAAVAASGSELAPASQARAVLAGHSGALFRRPRQRAAAPGRTAGAAAPDTVGARGRVQRSYSPTRRGGCMPPVDANCCSRAHRSPPAPRIRPHRSARICATVCLVVPTPPHCGAWASRSRCGCMNTGSTGNARRAVNCR